MLFGQDQSHMHFSVLYVIREICSKVGRFALDPGAFLGFNCIIFKPWRLCYIFHINQFIIHILCDV